TLARLPGSRWWLFSTSWSTRRGQRSEPGPGTSSSDVGAGLSSVDRDARAIEKARLVRANEHRRAGHLRHRPEPTQRHLPPHELGDAVWILLLPAMPSASLPEDRARGDAIHRDAPGCNLAGQRTHEADLGRLRGVVGGRAARLPTEDRGDDYQTTPAAIDHGGKHQLGHAYAHA